MKKGRKLPNSVSMDEFINLPLMNQHIFNLRNQKGYTQKEVANAIGVTDKTYRSWEKNGTGIEMYNLLSLADFYKVSVDYLLGRSEYTAVENELIGRETGLSDDSINILKWWHQDQEMSKVSGFNLFYGNEIECLNALLEHEWKRPKKGIAKTIFFWVWLYLCSASCRKASSKTVRYKYNDKNGILKAGDSINGNVISEYSIQYDKFKSVKIDDAEKIALEDTANNKMYQVDVSGLMETYTLGEITKSLQELKTLKKAR